MSLNMEILIAVVLFLACGGLIAWIIVTGRKTRLDARLDELTGQAATVPHKAGASLAKTTITSVATIIQPSSEEGRSLLRNRLIQAGFYSPVAMQIFLGVKVLLMAGPALVGLVLGLLGFFGLRYAVLGGACFGIVGMIGPSFWLDNAKKRWSAGLRRSLPDALDLLVICLEGGLTLQSGMRRISEELRTAHPALSNELLIVQREVQLGLRESDAMTHMAERTDLEEIRSLAGVILQAERFGTSLAKALRIHSEMLRYRRRQNAEEMAQKAGTKILFPTLLFIFPAIFVVILGPAFFQIIHAMSSMTD